MTPKTLDKYIAALKKKAAENGWTKDQYVAELAKFKDDLNFQNISKKITDEEYEKAWKKIENAEENMALQGKKKDETGSGAKSEPKVSQASKPAEKESYSKIYDWLVDISDEEIDGMDAMALTDMVEYLKKSNVDPDQAKKQVESAVDLIKNNGFTVEEAMNTAAGYKPGMKAEPVAQTKKTITDDDSLKLQNQLMDKVTAGEMSFEEFSEKQNKVIQMLAQGAALDDVKAAVGLTPKPAGMTHEEYIGLWQQLNDKKKAGLITKDEYNALGKKLDDHYSKKTPLVDVEKEIGLDPGTKVTDDAVIKLGKEIRKVYKQASEEMEVKLKGFLQEHEDEINELNQKLQAGTITPEEYKRLQLMVVQQKALKGKLDQLTGVMLNANQKALGMVNGQQVGVFAENANYQSYQLTQDAKVDLMFAIYDEDTAAKLLKEKPELIPRKEDVNGKKDAAWNQKIIAGATLQAVIQGDSIPKMAKRIAEQTGETNMKAMIRYARTAMTSAQNSGRMDTLHRAKGMGIKCKKRWLATLDSRTRDSHQIMDGKTVDVDEDFVTPLGSKMQFPGDMAGKPGDVWNCRCTMVYEYEDYPNDPTDNQRLYYDEYWTTETDEDGKEHKVFHRDAKLVTDMNYDEWHAAKEGTKLNDLNLAKVHLAEVQKDCLKKRVSETKVYKGLWKDDVTLADYPDKKDGIQAKRDYYTAEIEKYNQAKAEGKSWATDEKIDELVKKRKLLDEFEKHGELLQERNKALKAVQDIYDEVGLQKTAQANVAKAAAIKKAKSAAPASGGASAGTAATSGPGMSLSAAGTKKTQFAPDAWDDKTKKAAPFYNTKYDADKVLRPELDAMWDTLTDTEKYAVWEYTANSNPINKRLSGYADTRHWDRKDFVGYENAVWSLEDTWRPLPRYWQKFGQNGHSLFHKAITNFTKAIEKSELHEDIWFKRQSGEGGFAGILEGAGMDYNTALRLIQTDPSKLIGLRAKNHAFTSCGMAKDAMWNGNVYYRIYCPKGTKALYSEPQSNFGHTSPSKIYKKGDPYSTIGTEAEVVLQRGTEFRITGIKKRGNDYEVEMEVVAQPDYFQYGDEDTFNDGKTRHKR